MASTLLRISKVPASNICHRHAFVTAMSSLVSVTPGKLPSPSTSTPIYYVLVTIRFDKRPTRSFTYPLRATDLDYLILDILSLKKMEFSRNCDWTFHPHVDVTPCRRLLCICRCFGQMQRSRFQVQAVWKDGGATECGDSTFLWNGNHRLARRNIAEELNLYGAVLMSFLFLLLC